MKKTFTVFLILTLTPCFAWDLFKGNQGSLTGYCIPINQDIYKQLGIDPKQRLKSPNVMTDLFSAPNTNFNYNSDNSLKSKETKGVGAKAGVSIIYD